MLGLGVLSLRYAARSLALSRTLLDHQYQPTHLRDALRNRESFSTTPRLLASELPDDFINIIKHTELFKKLADKPKALKALSDLYELTKEMGIDINSKTPLSEFRMFQLVTNVRLMRVIRRVIDELKAAGLKTNSDDALQEIMGLTQEIRKKRIDDPNKREKPDKEDL